MALLVNAYGTATNSGAATRANVLTATYTVPANRRLKVTGFYLGTNDGTGGFGYLTTGAGGTVAANDVAAIVVLAAVPFVYVTFASPIAFAAGTVVTCDGEQTASGAAVDTHIGFQGFVEFA